MRVAMAPSTSIAHGQPQQTDLQMIKVILDSLMAYTLKAYSLKQGSFLTNKRQKVAYKKNLPNKDERRLIT